MTITLKTPDAPATAKQLWLLHILTKEDTRGLTLTMQEASDRIAELKNSAHRPLVNPHASAIGQDRQLRAQQKYDKENGKEPKAQSLNGIRITKAYKVVSMHKGNHICVSVQAYGIFPKGHKAHLLSFSYADQGQAVWITPLYTHIRNHCYLDADKLRQWIKPLPIVNCKAIPVPGDLWDKAQSLAKPIDRWIEILPLGEADG